jgi:hypothetical protein
MGGGASSQTRVSILPMRPMLTASTSNAC